MKRIFAAVIMLCVILLPTAAKKSMITSPIDDMLERIDPGLSKKMAIEIVPDTTDYFELSQKGDRPCIKANSYVSAATGINWYLKYTAGVHLSWNCMKAAMPSKLPAVKRTERHSTDMNMRYYLNYCTHSYSMAFWDADRWQREIDWMALHGINMPLCITGTGEVWYNVLKRLGYDDSQAKSFIAGPGFQAWWLMNNLEGWGGPATDAMLARDTKLQKGILAEMRRWGMKPVLPGYSGMLPHDAATRLGLPVADPGLWCGYNRPAFLSPDAPEFSKIADIYYEELHRLYGTADYYSMDPFHEGGNTAGVDLAAAGTAIMKAMKKGNSNAAWVVQAWQGNPRTDLIKHLDAADLVALDLHVESVPQWTRRSDKFCGHPWLYCMLLNFGGNVGLHGKMQWLIDQFYQAKGASPQMKGVGLTMEGIENNPIMYELLCELPWRESAPTREDWVAAYADARYGTADADARSAWSILSSSIYNAPQANRQQGTHESVFCARPSDAPHGASTWGAAEPYYSGSDVIEAAHKLLAAAPKLRDNDNYLYDLVDVTRQAVAEKARMVSGRFSKATTAAEYRNAATTFMHLLSMQDSLLSSRTEFMVGPWIESARACGSTDAERDLYEYNARVQITTWGLRTASERGALHDYAHREWSGILRDFYAMRWSTWFKHRLDNWDNPEAPAIDFYALEEPWTTRKDKYPVSPATDPVEMAQKALHLIDAI
ncbi:MAG: alpha-N-acetylglucosaminidase [Muribaculaceae bacterium]|nr:alpha-N-acetylglucosaminidase [Muribaculaceae bacterium]